MEKHLKEIAGELKLIRLELEQMNGVQLTEGGPKENLEALKRSLQNQKRDTIPNTMRMGV